MKIVHIIQSTPWIRGTYYILILCQDQTNLSWPTLLPPSLLHNPHQLRRVLANPRHPDIFLRQTPRVVSRPVDVDRADALFHD